MRKALNGMKPEEAVEKILDMFTKTRNNQEFVNMVKKSNYSALSKKSPKNCRNFLMLFKKLSTRQGLSCFVSQ